MSSSSERRLRASVIVVTRNNAELLADALGTILSDRSTVARELIVVDNGSTDSTIPVAERLAAAAPFEVRILAVSTPGLARGRNAGIAAARGELLLFTDDDVLVEDGWADALCAPFAHERVAVAGGRTLPLWPHDPPHWVHGKHRVTLALYDHGEHTRLLAPGEHLAGANMALRASALAAIPGPFDISLGNTRDRRFSYEETALVEHLRERHLVAYTAAAVVQHRIRAERLTLEWMRGTYFDQGAAVWRIDRTAGKDDGAPAARLAARAGRAAARALTRRLANLRGRTADSTWTELQAYRTAGYAVERVLGRFPRLTRTVRDLVA